MKEVLIDTILDSIKLLPFLLVASLSNNRIIRT